MAACAEKREQLSYIVTARLDRAEQNFENELDFAADRFRRNLVTRGVRLDDWLDREFQLGEVVLRGVRLCEPCAYLSERTDRRFPKAMLHRAGLRAQILVGGKLVLGQVLTPRPA